MYSVVRTATHIYLAGDFTTLVSNGGTDSVPAGNIAALNPDGTPDRTFSVTTNGTVRKIALGPDGNLYVGGAFTTLTDPGGSQAHPRVARILVGTGTVDASWSPSVSGTNAVVYGLAFSPPAQVGEPAVYVGGRFSGASTGPAAAPRDNAAAFGATTGSLQPWAPAADNNNNPTDPHGPSVRDILVDTSTQPGTTRVYIAGEFDEVNQNTAVHGVALVTPDTGALVLNSTGSVAFVPPLSTCNDGLALAMGTYGLNKTPALWLADGGQCNGLFAFAPGTGRKYKQVQSDGDVQTLAVQGDYVYVGGHFLTFDNITTFVHTARVAMATGTADASWSPAMSPSIAPYFYGVWSVFPYTDQAGTYYLYEAGVFKNVNGVPAAKFAWFTNAAGAAPGAPTNVAATPGDSSATVTWNRPASDGGSAIMSYTVTASPGPAAATVSGSPPATSATVTGLTNGVSYTFTVTASNAAGTGPPSAPSSAVTPSSTAQCGPPGAPRYNIAAPPAALSVDSPPTVPGAVSWTSAAGAGCSYELQRSDGGGQWSTVYSGSATSDSVSLAVGGSYAFQVRSIDSNAVPSAWATGATFSLNGGQETDAAVTYAGTFTSASNTGYWGGTAASTVALSDSATVSFSGSSIAIVGIKCPGCGAIQVYVDGVKAGQVTEYASTTAYRRIIFTKSWSSSGTHAVRIENLGTSGHGKMVLDGFVTIG